LINTQRIPQHLAAVSQIISSSKSRTRRIEILKLIEHTLAAT